MQVLNWDKQVQKKIRRDYSHVFDPKVFKKVNRILGEVRKRGDLAIRRFSREFDGLDLPLKRIAVSVISINSLPTWFRRPPYLHDILLSM